MNELTLKLMSFGFLYGVPQADMVLDMRGLQNPFYVPELREKTGLNREVRDYIFSFPESGEYLQAVLHLLQLRLQLAEKYGRPLNLTFAIGCTGGRHRSVAMTVTIAERLWEMGYHVTVQHRELDQ